MGEDLMNSRFVAATLAATLLVGTANAAVLFDNGPVIEPGGLSILITPANSTLGFGSNANARLADNFTVSGPGWTVESLSFYGYQTGATGFTFTGASWSIIAGNDVNTGTVVAAGNGSITNGGLVGYRVTNTTLTATNRPIFRIDADVTDFSLGAGNYFLTWQLAGSLGSGPFVPPVFGSLGAGNALQSLNGGAYSTLRDGGSQLTADVPFTINGTAGAVVPEPSSWALMLIGFGAVAGTMRLRRRGAAHA
jgi:hypothetical protein